MKTNFQTIALIGKQNSPEATEAIAALNTFLQNSGITVLIKDECNPDTAAYNIIGTQADLAIIVGGDGTMLRSARYLAPFNIPLVGVNQGHLGFMTDIAQDKMLEGMTELLAGKYKPEQRILLDMKTTRQKKTLYHGLALNDVVVSKGDVGRMIEFSVTINEEFVYNQRSDGLIVATPTGSTAYALSANGPILHPAVAGITLVPLCPHTLSNRPITVNDQCYIEITVLPPYSARVHCDGQSHLDLQTGDTVCISRSIHTICLLHPPAYSYFAMLREKLHWSEAPRKQT